MLIKCKGFFDIKSKELVRNYCIKWNGNTFEILKSCEYYDKIANYLIPSFCDAHVHLFLSGDKDLVKREKELSLSLDESLKIAEKNVKKLMDFGVYSVIDAGDSKLCAFTLRDSKRFENFRIKASGKALFKKGRYGSFIGYEITDFLSLRYALNDLLNKKIDIIKVLNSGINSVKEYSKETEPQFSFKEMDYIVKFAKDNNLDVIVHVNGYLAIKETVKHNVNRLEHAFFIKDDFLIKDIAQRGIKIVPTFRAMYNLIENKQFSKKEKEIIKKTVINHTEEIKKFIKYGGKVLLGTDSGSFNVYHGNAFFDEIKFFMDNLEFSFEDILSVICNIESSILLEIKDFNLDEILNRNFKILELQ